MAISTGGQQRGVQVHTGTSLSPPRFDDAAAWGAYFEELYKDAAGDAARVPWADERPNPPLVAWLNREAPGIMRPGASVTVVGCGLGDDVRELAERGYDPVGFDVSPTAMEWARRRFPTLSDRFLVADVFSPPTSMQRRADLVVEINTLQAVHPGLRGRAAAGVVALARPRGIILTICRGRAESDAPSDAPPFAMTPRELTETFACHGWTPMRSVDDFVDDEDPPKRRLRVAFKRGNH